MVEVFKTSVTSPADAAVLIGQLQDHFPLHRINFDLHDCDNILRVEGGNICTNTIIQLITARGHECCVLE